MKILLYRILIAFSLLSAITSLVVPTILWIKLFPPSATQEQERCIRKSGLPCDAEIDEMEFSDWIRGGDKLRLMQGDFPQEMFQHPIIRHRIGHIDTFFSRFTYYQVEVLNPDKSILLWGAEGPLPLLSRQPFIWEVLFGGWFLASLLLCFFAFKKISDARKYPAVENQRE